MYTHTSKLSLYKELKAESLTVCRICSKSKHLFLLLRSIKFLKLIFFFNKKIIDVHCWSDIKNENWNSSMSWITIIETVSYIKVQYRCTESFRFLSSAYNAWRCYSPNYTCYWFPLNFAFLRPNINILWDFFRWISLTSWSSSPHRAPLPLERLDSIHCNYSLCKYVFLCIHNFVLRVWRLINIKPATIHTCNISHPQLKMKII